MASVIPYIYDMYQVTEHAEMHYFTDGTSLLYGYKSLKKNQINFLK